MIRKLILFLTPLLILTILFLVIILVVNRESGKGALQVTSVPASQVFLNGKFIGKTPLCLCELTQLLKIGEYNIKLVPTEKGFKEYEQKITIYQGVLTVVDRTFDKQSSASTGSVITLSSIEDKDKSEILVISFPSGAQVILDSNPKGVTPLLLKDIPPSDHEIKIIKDGYKEKIVKIKTIAGKKLETTVNLGIRTDLTAVSTKASSSAEIKTQKIIILDTPTGFLRVREENSVNSVEIGTVSPGDKLDLISEKEDWYEVTLPSGKIGWISAIYAKKE